MTRQLASRFSPPSHPVQAGQAYLITLVTRHQIPFFSDHFQASRVAREISELARQGCCHNWCYVVMPDHCQWMLTLEDASSLAHVVRLMTGKTSRLAAVPLWQRGFTQQVLRQDQDLLPTARHVIAAPLRAGLVSRVGDYPYWNAAWL